jgi:putative oxygen-independent coproporphyrinogen III oxidase
MSETRRRGSRNVMIYIQIPFCTSKCHFCGWVQGMSKQELLLSPTDQPRRDYVDAICAEIRGRAAAVRRAGYVPNIIYWGGGTGTALVEAEIERIHAALVESYDLSSVTEATFEGSPDTVTPAKLRFIHSLGYTRISLGVQSFNDKRLRHLGRVHDAARARAAVEWAATEGFRDINIDLMCGLPGEVTDEVQDTVRTGVALPVTHISYYAYRPIHDTVMQKQLSRGLSSVDANYQKRAYRIGRDIIERADFAAYALSYFGQTSLNDLALFRLTQDWLGFGSGAHSLMAGQSLVHERGRMLDYVARPLMWDFATPAHSPNVAPMLLGQGLSTFKGINRRDWEERTGQSLEQTIAQPAVRAYLDKFVNAAGLEETEEGIRLDSEKMIDVFIDELLGLA